MIYHPCYSIIHTFKKIKNQNQKIFPSTVPQVHKKYRKKLPNENTKYICDLISICYFQKINTDMFTEQRSSFFNSNRRDGLFFFFSRLLLLCAVLLVTVLQRWKVTNYIYSRYCN